MKKSLLLALICFFYGCGAGDGSGSDDRQTDSDLQGLAQIQAEIFSPICAECHIGAIAPQGLRLDSLENSFDFLVGIDSAQVPELLRVAPGDPDNSYLIRKIEGAIGIVGSQMPLGQAVLSSQQIGLIRDWILGGALASDAQKSFLVSDATENFVALTAVVPTTVESIGIIKTATSLSFEIYFSRAIDPASLDGAGPQIFLVDGSNVFSVPSHDYTYSLSNMQMTVTYNGNPQAFSGLDLVLNYSGLAALRDVNGVRVDGDNDGLEGGEFHYEYQF